MAHLRGVESSIRQMSLRFTKMHGAGNDYVYVDCFNQPVPGNATELARAISDRHVGVGADGLILICPTNDADAEMRMYNADGSRAEMCGNGIRCVAKYVYERKIAVKGVMHIESAGVVYELSVTTCGGKVSAVRVDMGEPILDAEKIPTTFSGTPPLNVALALPSRDLRVTCVSMGNPHCVAFVDELDDETVLGLGPIVEKDAHFPNRVNVEFVKVDGPREATQRTWERGSGETLACGTGACAVCVAGALTGRTERSLVVHLRGGDLNLEWNEKDNHVYMTGPAVEVFTGQWPS